MFADINALHPFREGNGRSQRLFIESLAKINGIYLDLTEVTKEDMIIASHESIKGNYHKLKEIFIKYSYALDDKEKLKYKEDKKEQEEIDNDYRKQAKELVNKMVAYLKKDSTLPDFDDRESLFKVPSSSNDFYVVTRDAYFHSLKLFKQDGAQETGQIKQIKVLAGDINDFYVEMTYTSTITYLGETETMDITYHYRIKKGKDCYLVAFVGYRVPGDIGLVKCDPVIEKDVSTNEDYAYSVGGQ